MPDGSAWDPNGGVPAGSLIYRNSPYGAQRFSHYDPIDAPEEPPVDPDTPVPTNAPVVEIYNASPVATFYTRAGDLLQAIVEVDDGDGATTTSVSIYESPNTLVGVATNDGGGFWSLDFAAGSAGQRQLFARRVTSGGSIDSDTWPLKSVKNPVEIFGNTRLKHWRFGQAADLTLSGTSVDQWNDLSTNPTPTPAVATLTARPTWRAPGDGSNDGSLIAPDFIVPDGEWGYPRYDGVDDVMNIAALNFPTPGASQRNFFFKVFRFYAWILNDRIDATQSVNARQVVYMSPTSPRIGMLNGAASAQNQVPNIAQDQWCLMMGEFTGSTSDFLKMMNYLSTGGNAGTSAGGTGRKEGGDVAAGVFSAIDVHQSGAVTDAASVTTDEMDEIVDYCRYLYQPGVAVPDGVLIYEGDSITAASGPNGATYAEQATYNPLLIQSFNIATGGESSANALAQFAAQAATKKNSGTSPAIPTVYSLLIGLNDFPVFGIPFATTIQNIKDTIVLARAQSMLVIGWNLLDQFAFTGADLTNYNSLRAALLSEIPPLVDYFINPAGVIPGGGSGPNWNPDAIHPTAAGQAYIVPLIQEAVTTLVPSLAS